MNLLLRYKQVRTKQLLDKLEKRVNEIREPVEVLSEDERRRIDDLTIAYRKKIRKLWWFEYLKIRDEVTERATLEGYMINGHSSRKGACFGIWNIERQVMKETYGAVWFTECDIAPSGTRFD